MSSPPRVEMTTSVSARAHTHVHQEHPQFHCCGRRPTWKQVPSCVGGTSCDLASATLAAGSVSFLAPCATPVVFAAATLSLFSAATHFFSGTAICCLNPLRSLEETADQTAQATANLGRTITALNGAISEGRTLHAQEEELLQTLRKQEHIKRQLIQETSVETEQMQQLGQQVQKHGISVSREMSSMLAKVNKLIMDKKNGDWSLSSLTEGIKSLSLSRDKASKQARRYEKATSALEIDTKSMEKTISGLVAILEELSEAIETKEQEKTVLATQMETISSQLERAQRVDERNEKLNQELTGLKQAVKELETLLKQAGIDT